MDGGAHKEEEIQKLRNIVSQYEEVINHQKEKIRKLQDQLANQGPNDVLGKIRKLEEDIRSYADRTVINWADDCECRGQIIQVADMLKTVGAQNLKVAATTCPSRCSELQNPGVSVATQTIRGLATRAAQTVVDEESLQTARAEMEDNSTQIRRLRNENARLFEKYDKMKSHLKAKIEDIQEEHRREMDYLKRQSDKEKARLIQKIRDMREEIISEKEKRGDVHRAMEQVAALRKKYYKETGELQCQVRHLQQQIRDMNERQPQPRTLEKLSTTSQTGEEKVQGGVRTRRRLHREF